MRALVGTSHGVFAVDLEADEVLGLEPGTEPPPPRVTAVCGSTVVVALEGRPPLRVSYDAGETWHDAGRGLPPGHAVAVSDDDPDTILYAGRNRLYLSRDGGRFWQALTVELPEIRSVAFA